MAPGESSDRNSVASDSDSCPSSFDDFTDSEDDRRLHENDLKTRSEKLFTWEKEFMLNDEKHNSVKKQYYKREKEFLCFKTSICEDVDSSMSPAECRGRGVLNHIREDLQLREIQYEELVASRQSPGENGNGAKEADKAGSNCQFVQHRTAFEKTVREALECVKKELLRRRRKAAAATSSSARAPPAGGQEDVKDERQDEGEDTENGEAARTATRARIRYMLARSLYRTSGPQRNDVESSEKGQRREDEIFSPAYRFEFEQNQDTSTPSSSSQDEPTAPAGRSEDTTTAPLRCDSDSPRRRRRSPRPPAKTSSGAYAATPCILKYMAEWENWSCKDKWKTPEEFQKHHGDTPIHITEFFPPDSNVKPYKVRIPIKDYISYARETQADFPWYPFERDFDTTVFTKNNHGAKIDQENREFLLQDFQPLPELFGIQDVFELTSRLRHEFFPYSCHRFVILGGKRTGANVHQDPLHTAAWNLLLAGRKRWVFFKPGTGEKEMRLQSVSSKTSTSTQADVDDGARSRIPSTNSRSCSSTTDETESCNSYQKKKPSRYNDSAPFDWWAEAYPKIKEDKTVELYEVVQNPGDTVYIPPDWYHAVLNLDDFTVACTSNVLTVKMLLKILQAYDAEEIKFSDAMLEEMQLGLEILLEEIAAPAQIDKDIINEEMMQRSPKRSSASCIMQKNSCHAAAHDEITTGRRDCRVHYGGS
ncbi:unnamed protein product [Amoebophrya sp. A120]|nr:unnamed protein product [Amoebophrya sp. A120]|eukprot:GSA120T00009193001.1